LESLTNLIKTNTIQYDFLKSNIQLTIELYPQTVFSFSVLVFCGNIVRILSPNCLVSSIEAQPNLYYFWAWKCRWPFAKSIFLYLYL